MPHTAFARSTTRVLYSLGSCVEPPPHLSAETAIISSVANMKGFLLCDLGRCRTRQQKSRSVICRGWMLSLQNDYSFWMLTASVQLLSLLNNSINFKLYMPWSSASHCANEAPTGLVVTCTDSQCSMFQSHNATVAAIFVYVCNFLLPKHTQFDQHEPSVTLSST